MQFTSIFLLASAAIGTNAAPAGEVHARASGVQLARIGTRWQAGWTGTTTASQRFTCSNNGLLVSRSNPDILLSDTPSEKLMITLAEHPELQLCLCSQREHSQRSDQPPERD
jgi:hypothetical protein